MVLDSARWMTRGGRWFVWGVWVVCGLGLAGSAMALSQAADFGWAPLVQLTGAGDKARAVGSLSRYTALMNSVVRHLEMDAATQVFLNETLESLEDFDLKNFYRSLPEERVGWRRLSLSGRHEGGRYRVRQATGDFEVNVNGSRRALGDMSSVLRARPVSRADGTHSYVMHARGGVNVGQLTWRDAVRGAEELLRLAAGEQAGEETAPSRAALAATQRNYPHLGAEDARVMARYWDAFPASSRLFASLAEVEDVLTARAPDAGYTQVRVRGRLSVAKIKGKYPELADFLDDLDELARLDLRWLDNHGRTLLTLHLDTDTQRFGVDLYTRGGRLLPLRGGRPVVDAPVDPMGSDLTQSHFRIGLVSKVLGLKVALKNLRVDFSYEPAALEVRMAGRARRMPVLAVSGAAMGFIPRGLIDVFIPGNIEQIMTDFVATAVRGNEGRGVALAMHAGQASAGQTAVVEGTVGAEILDNFFVKMGMGIVADRILPDEDALLEMRRLAIVGHDVFAADLRRYAQGG